MLRHQTTSHGRQKKWVRYGPRRKETEQTYHRMGEIGNINNEGEQLGHIVEGQPASESELLNCDIQLDHFVTGSENCVEENQTSREPAT